MATEDDRPSVFPGFESITVDTAEVIAALTTCRLTCGLSQTEVAARMGTSQSALARLESGQSDVRLSTLSRYAAAIDADLSFAVRRRQED